MLSISPMPHHEATELEQDAQRMLTARRVELVRAGAEGSELELVDAALARLRAATYGDCTSCGGAVGRARLRAIPEALHCVQCRGCPVLAVTAKADERGATH